MRYRFGHARATRQVADDVVVEIELDDGARGWGEGVPRDYVTGETIASVFGALTRVAELPLPLRDGASFGETCAAFAAIDLPALLGGETAMPAAAAALELAVLDAHARREGRPLLDAIGASPFASLLRPTPPAHVRQTLTIGDDLDGALARAGEVEGPVDLKLKLGFDDDLRRGQALRARFGEDVDLRGDANAAWTRAQATEVLATLAPLRLSSVEEPLRDRDLEGCAALRRAGTAVMLDESLRGLGDADRAIALAAADLFNLRLSKNGGLFGSLRLVQRAEQAGLGWQLGAMVGETGILSSLGRGFVSRVRGARYFESTVPTRSLEADITSAALDHLGRTRDTPVPSGIGFGAEVLPDVLERYTVARLVIDR
jgi:L-alanine-DL-glutamate epimerase-like enolase superfamily enzyme